MYQLKEKQKNDLEFLNYIYKNKKFTISEVSKSLNITYPTAKRLIEDYIRKNLVYQSNDFFSTNGRSSIIFSTINNCFYSIGIEIELRKIIFILIDIYGKIIKEKIILNIEFSKENFKYILKQYLNEFYLELEEDIKNKILGIGISVPGITSENNFKISNAINLGLKDLNLINTIKEYNKNIFIENDANSCIYSEKIIGLGKEFKNFIVISIGSGIGTGIYINSQIYRGKNQMAGEFGHMTIDIYGKKCKCGNVGCWELYVSESAISKKFKNIIPIDLKEIFNEEKNLKFIEEYIYYFSLGLKNIILALDINNIIISGTISKYINKNKIEEKIRENVFLKDSYFNIQCSNLNERSSILGAALIPISKYFNLV